MALSISSKVLVAFSAAVFLTACEEGGPFASGTPSADGEATPAAAAATEFIERDVEAPEVFSAETTGLWDGRPSLGGIWVAHPDVTSPERVTIRNTANGREVVGALFRREREMPGPRIQVSSEAADALGMLAGQPAELSVVALKRERIPVLPPAPEVPAEGEIEATPLDDPAQTAAAAMAAVASPPASASARPTPRPAAAPPPPAPLPEEEAEPEPEPEASAVPSPAPTPVAAASPPPVPAGSPDQPYIQIGIFSVEENARNAGESLRLAGVIPTIRNQTSGERSYWRVLVGPVTSTSERSTILAKVRDLGYSDAYAVSN